MSPTLLLKSIKNKSNLSVIPTLRLIGLKYSAVVFTIWTRDSFDKGSHYPAAGLWIYFWYEMFSILVFLCVHTDDIKMLLCLTWCTVPAVGGVSSLLSRNRKKKTRMNGVTCIRKSHVSPSVMCGHGSGTLGSPTCFHGNGCSIDRHVAQCQPPPGCDGAVECWNVDRGSVHLLKTRIRPRLHTPAF